MLDTQTRILDAELSGHVFGFSSTFRTAWRASREFADALPKQDGRLIVVGLGGSATAGDIVAELAAHCGHGSIELVRGHTLPRGVQRSDLVVICSYGGTTFECRLAFEEACRRGLRVAVVTASEDLVNEAQLTNSKVFQVRYDAPPRHSLAWLIPPLLRHCSTDEEVELALERLDQLMSGERPRLLMMAEAIASRILAGVPVLAAAEFLKPVARRWKNQFNENAKHPAFAEELPEAAHNSIEGHANGSAGAAAHLVLWSERYSQPARVAVDSYATVLARSGAPVQRVMLDLPTPLAEVLGLVVLGDLVSLCMASQKGVDPLPIPRIEDLKREIILATNGSTG